MTIELKGRDFVQTGATLGAGAAFATIPSADYGAKAGDCVEAFIQAIRWSNVDGLYARYSRG